MSRFINGKLAVILSVLLVLCLALSGCNEPISDDAYLPADSVANPAPSSAVQPPENEADDSQSEPEMPLTLGGVADGKYTNESLGIAMDVPEDWYILDEEQLLSLMDLGSEALQTKEKMGEELYELALQRTLTLMGAYEFNPLLQGDKTSPSSIVLMAERIATSAKLFIRSADDYLTLLESELSSITEIEGLEASYQMSDRETVTLNGKEFSKLTAGLTGTDGTVYLRQTYCVYFDKQYVYLALLTYIEDDQLPPLEDILHTLTIE